MSTKTRTSKSSTPKGTKGTPAGVSFVLPFAPIPAPRPRVSRWGTYYPKSYQEWQATAAAFLETITDRLPEAHLKVDIICVCHRPPTTKLTTPRGDVDNYEKAVMDSITKAGIWPDDKWVVDCRTRKRFAGPHEEPHARVVVTLCD